MTPDRSRGLGGALLAPVGVVGPGGTSSAISPSDSAAGKSGLMEPDGEARPPRRFVVPDQHRSPDGTLLREMVELRRLAREGALRLGVDQTTILLFGGEESPVRQVVRFRQVTRTFQKLESHAPGLAREARAMLTAVSRVEVADVRENTPPPGPMRDYLRKAEIRGLLALPLRHAGEMAGFVSFETIAQPRSWSREERGEARHVAALMEEVLTPALLASVSRAWQPDAPRRGRGAPTDPHPAAETPQVPDDDTVDDEVLDERDREVSRGRHVPSPSTRIPRLRPLEGAALLGADIGEDLLHLVEVQEATLSLLRETLQAADGEAIRDADAHPQTDEVMADLLEVSRRLRGGIGSVVRMTRDGRVGGEVVDLNQTLASLVHRLAKMVGDGPRFVFAPASEPLPARAEPLLLERALEHVLRNAQAAVVPGDRIRISWERVPTRGGPEGRRRQDDPQPDETVRIRIQDEGRGIRPDHLPWVFQPYFSASSEDSDAGPTPRRVGLGLSTVQAIVEGHGGWVDLRSRPGEGTTVDLHLPLAEARESAEPDSASEPDSDADVGTPVVLLMEDEPLLARLMARILTREGCRVLVAESQKEALRHWSGWSSRVSLIMVERRLAGVADPDGMVREWMERGEAADVVVLDRRGGSEDPPPQGVEPGDYFSRPFDPSEVARKIRRRLARRELGRTGGARQVNDSDPDPGRARTH